MGVGFELITWTTGLETRRGLKVNLQPKERAESDRKETVMMGRSNSWPITDECMKKRANPRQG